MHGVVLHRGRELSWDQMEPAGFFVMSTFSLLGQLYFLYNTSEYSNEDLQTRLFNRFVTGMYRRAGFDLAAYEKLKQRVEDSAL